MTDLLDILVAAWKQDSAREPVTYRQGVTKGVPAINPCPTPDFDYVRNCAYAMDSYEEMVAAAQQALEDVKGEA